MVSFLIVDIMSNILIIKKEKKEKIKLLKMIIQSRVYLLIFYSICDVLCKLIF